MTSKLSKKDKLKYGVDVIKACLKSLSSTPGVYRMLDDQGKVLYVGKAKNLKNRVSNYSRVTGHSARITRMINATSSMVFLTTETEIEALLLEQNLIKQLKPKYNVLLRDDKSFPDIVMTMNHPFPQVIKSRGQRLSGNKYFGPFATVGSVNRTLNYLQRIFLLRNCSDSIFESRTRPCLQYQIKRCSAPCVGKISKENYGKAISDSERFLSGKTTNIKKRLAEEMYASSAELDFERAAVLRDQIQALTHIQGNQGINPKALKDADLFALASQGSQVCIQVFFFRGGQNWGNKAYFPLTGSGAQPGEILEAFLMQFYRVRSPPPLIMTSHDPQNLELIVSGLFLHHGKSVRIEKPSRGEKIKLIFNGLRNASEELARKIAEYENQTRLLEDLSKAFKLNKVLERIEVYDNSHIQGTSAVGAMVVAGSEGFIKSQYRKFNINEKAVKSGDDVGMIYHVLTRRFSRSKDKKDLAFSQSYPDILLIDGGANQISAANRALKELGINKIPIFGVAKGSERDKGKEIFHRVGGSSFALNYRDPVLFFIQRLRDEAHRFAIGAHRKKRSKSIQASYLDDIAGIGASRKRALLSHFGSTKEVREASLEDLQVVEGISKSIAKLVYNYFRDVV